MKTDITQANRIFVWNVSGVPDYQYLTNVNIVDNTIWGGKISDNTIWTTKIIDKNITIAKIADSTANNILLYNASGVATSGKLDWILNGAWRSAWDFAYHLSYDSWGNPTIRQYVTNTQINTNSINGDRLTVGTIPLNKMIIDNTINNKVLTYSSGVCIADFIKTAMITDGNITYWKLQNPMVCTSSLIIGTGGTIRRQGIRLIDDTNTGYECFVGTSSGIDSGGGYWFNPHNVLNGTWTASSPNNWVMLSGRTNDYPWAICLWRYGGAVICSRFSSVSLISSTLVEPAIVMHDSTLSAQQWYAYFDY